MSRIKDWWAGHMPTRETFERIGWLRPVAHLILAPALWRFTRRSVPRGVALGILVGVLVPVAQTVFAALLAFPTRANVPIASATTLITNPFTTPPIWAFSFWLGSHMLLDLGVPIGAGGNGRTVFARPTGMSWGHWLLHDVGPALLLGLVVVAVMSAAIGYLAAAFGWRWWIVRRWRRRGRQA